MSSPNFSDSEVIKDYTERDYRTVWQKPRSQFEHDFEIAIIEALLPKSTGWFIDIGGGYGRMYPYYKKEGRKVVIVDYALNLLEMADEEFKNEKDLYLIAADAYHLPFRDEVFDAGIQIRVFHHMNLPQKFLKELSRVLRSGGEILFEYSNKRNILRMLKKGATALEKNHEEYAEWQFGTHPTYLKKISGEMGMRVGASRGTAFFPRYITDKTLFLDPIFRVLEILFDATLGRMGLAPMEFSLFQKSGDEAKKKDLPQSVDDILVCPKCKGSLRTENERMVCLVCSQHFPKKGKIIDFRFKE